jgi:hypothetical protein
MDRIEFYDKNTIKNIQIDYPDIYFTPEYGLACEYSDNAEWECCIYKDLIYVYLKKPITHNNTYYDLITPYGYSGYYFLLKDTYDEFLPLFREKAKEKKYVSEVVRQNPYINIKITDYEIKISKNTMGININKYTKFEDYLNSTHKDNRRGYNIGIKNKLLAIIEPFNEENLNKFKIIYEETMDNLGSSDYYYFNNNYYNSLLNLKDNTFFMSVYKDNILIAICIIFKYNKFLHYHIGGSLKNFRYLRPNNFLHCNVIKYGIENNYDLYHLGGGLKDNDTLFNFKNKISDTFFSYNIYKNNIQL